MPEEGETKNSRRGTMAGGGVVSRLWRAARRIALPCLFIFRDAASARPSNSKISCPGNEIEEHGAEKNQELRDPTDLTDNSICSICLEPLFGSSSHDSKAKDGDDGDAVFRAQCSHCFHCMCIASNIRHGNVTCPICRAPSLQLPRSLKLLPSSNASDPVLQILDESIATSRLIRRSSLRTSRYDDDDPIDADALIEHKHPSSLQFSLVLSPVSSLCRVYQFTSSSLSSLNQNAPDHQRHAHLCVRLSPQPPVDLVLVVNPNGPRMRLLKQALALVVFALRPSDRLAIVTYFGTANRAFPLRRMTFRGKQMALQVIDRLLYTPDTNSKEGIQKGVKILEERMHCNPGALILQLSDNPVCGLPGEDPSGCIPIHRFHVGPGFGTPNGFLMHDFEAFLMRLLGGAAEDVRLKIGENGTIVRVGELKGGEERRIPLDIKADCGFLVVGYSYTEAGSSAQPITGEAAARLEEKAERGSRNQSEEKDLRVRGRRSCAERWDHLDPFLSRRWVKHLHSYKA